MGPQPTVSYKPIQVAISSRRTTSQLRALTFLLVPLRVCSTLSPFMLEIPTALISLKESPPKIQVNDFVFVCLFMQPVPPELDGLGQVLVGIME